MGDRPPPLFAERLGESGPPFVAIHGLGASSRYWRPAIDVLAEQYRVVLPDLLGFGRSPWPAVEYTVDDHLSALRRTLGQVLPNGEPIILLGHSAGANLALAYAARWPSEVRALALLSPAFYRDRATAKRHLGKLGFMSRLMTDHPVLAAAMCWTMCHTRPVLRVMLPLLIRNYPPEVVADGVQHTWPSYSGTFEHAVMAFGPEKWLPVTASVPTLVLHGTDDRTVPFDGVRQFVETWSKARLVPIPGADHDPWLRNSAFVLACLAELLDGLAASNSGVGG